MSHVVTPTLQYYYLDCLKKAIANIPGLKFNEGKTRYRWFERFVGDSPMPEGFTWHGRSEYHTYDPTKRMLGTCEHTISLESDQGYEVGVYQKEDGSWGLIYDYYCGGEGLMSKISKEYRTSVSHHNLYRSKDCGVIEEEYCLQVAGMTAQQQGWICERVGNTLTIYHPEGGEMKVSGGTVEANNFVGSACTSPVTTLINAMGTIKSIENTSEYYENSQELTQEES